ncbi:MAG: hypothetical protein KKA73_29315 [Chloroflexi bacterium]|nr:hypothetical protein [Chloroflexota bacterium]MBU1751796.1 hypothetical protein [Chloroflexota bacterium]
MLLQVPGHPHQPGCEPFGTDMVQALGNQPHGLRYRQPIDAPAGLLLGVPLQVAVQ